MRTSKGIPKMIFSCWIYGYFFAGCHHFLPIDGNFNRRKKLINHDMLGGLAIFNKSLPSRNDGFYGRTHAMEGPKKKSRRRVFKL